MSESDASALERLLARRRLNRLVAVAAQIYNDKAAYAALVFEDKYLLVYFAHAPSTVVFLHTMSSIYYYNTSFANVVAPDY